MNNACKEYSATSIQQLTKLITDKQSGELKEKNVYPISLVQSIFDGITGNRLDVILSLFNCIYIPYGDSKRSTRLKVSNQMRRLGLIITFKDATNTIYTQRYVGTSFDDANWSNDKNWEDCFVSFDSSEAVEQLKQYFTNYINNIIGDITGVKFIVVSSLPSVGEKGTIYLMKNNSSTEANNIYDEYIWLADKNIYEKLGSFSTSIDLSNYQPKLVSGQNIKTINGQSILGSGNIEIVVGDAFPSDGVEGQYLKKSDTGVKWDDGDIFCLNARDVASGSVTQAMYNKLVNAITNNKIIYLVSNFDGENRAYPPVSIFYEESSGITFNTLMGAIVSTVHINPDLTVVRKEVINFNLDGYVKYDWFALETFKISGDAVTYSPTVISNNDAQTFCNAYDNHQRLQLLLGSGSDKFIDLFPTQFNSVSPTYPGSKYSFIGITKYNDKCYTILLSLIGLSSANDRDWQLVIDVIPHFYIENSTFRNNQFIKRKEDNTYEWSTIEYPRIVLSEFSAKKFFEEYSMVIGADSIGWAGALLIDDFSSDKYRDFYCCMTYGQGIVIRHTYATDTYAYLNSFLADFSTTSSSYNQTNKMNSGGWGKVYEGSVLPLAYISRCSPDSNYIHTYYAYQIDTSVTPYTFTNKLTIKYGGSKLAAITSDITIDAEKKHLYIHGYKTGSIDAIRGTSIVMVFNIPEPSNGVTTITLTDNDILWEFEFFVDEAAQDLYVSGGRLYYPYGGSKHHGLAVIDTSNGAILQNIDLTNISTNFINSPEPEGVYVSNGKLYLNYHHSNTNKNEVCLVEFPLQEVKESIPVATNKTNGLLSFKDKEKLDNLRNSIQVLTQEEYNALGTKSETTIYFIKG